MFLVGPCRVFRRRADISVLGISSFPSPQENRDVSPLSCFFLGRLSLPQFLSCLLEYSTLYVRALACSRTYALGLLLHAGKKNALPPIPGSHHPAGAVVQSLSGPQNETNMRPTCYAAVGVSLRSQLQPQPQLVRLEDNGLRLMSGFYSWSNLAWYCCRLQFYMCVSYAAIKKETPSAGSGGRDSVC